MMAVPAPAKGNFSARARIAPAVREEGDDRDRCERTVPRSWNSCREQVLKWSSVGASVQKGCFYGPHDRYSSASAY